MEKIKYSNSNRTNYIGLDFREVRDSLPVKPNDTLMFCDLRGCRLDGLDLSRVEFFGCRLNGTSFRGTTLLETHFIGCFSSDLGQPTDFRDSFWQDVLVEESHFNCLSDQEASDYWRWSTVIADIASDTLAERNDVRYDAAKNLGKLGNPVVAPILACLLADKEWEVRLVSLRALGELRQPLGEFPYRDQALMKWMFLRLGDENAFVRSTASELVGLLSPSNDVLLTSIDRMQANSREERLAGLRVATELCRLDTKYSRLLKLETIKNLLSDEAPEVRSASLDLLGILDNPSTVPWILRALSDPVASVRIDALLAICRLSESPPASLITPLLDDTDEQVRLQVLNTLREIGGFDPKELETRLSDPSAEVRRAAQKLLKGF